MTSLTIAPPGAPRTIGMFGCNWDDFDFCLVEPEVEIGGWGLPKSSFDHHGSL